MKAYKYIILLIATISILGCDDEINDLEPFTEGNPDTFFNSLQSFQNGLDGMYSQFFEYYSDESGYQGIPDILSDNVILATTGRRSNETIYDWKYVPTTQGAVALFWSSAYEAVSASNLVISQIDNLPEGEERDNILGQALAGRAIAHFDLVRLYAQIPTQDSNASKSLGIVYMKVEDGDVDDPFANPSRETVESNYQEIIGDLERAVELIGDDNGEGRLDKDAINGILSRVYLYNGEYGKVVEVADKVNKSIASADELSDVYQDVTNAGILIEWSVNTSSESNFNNVGVIYSQTTPPNTRSEYVGDFEFVNSISENDVRKNILTYVGTISGNNYNAIGKFLGEPGQVNGRVDTKVLRVAEVILNKAEAQYRLGQEADALVTLNALRDARLSSYTGGEIGSALLEEILRQRRIELAFEGHRFFDLKRLGLPVERSNNGDIIDGTGTPPEKLSLPANNFRFQFPIPQDEINANPNMEQNPDY
ncbi:RagB/SusD family nutrient uptake outer membrane protein [Zunongwangia sp.]|uniref:RagB/SusD family nutrient uptake outer membrane protein n=1 Tax=Zunongwangia sp. TaxID=1965325 RepID=UPI003AA97390